MRRGLRLLIGAAIVGANVCAGIVRATLADKFVSTTVALGRFDDIDVNNYALSASFWKASEKIHGAFDLYVQSNVWQPGGTTGWHTHPGQSLIIVTTGTVTAYEGDDASCTPHVYTPGMGFVDPGGGHVHVVRNEGSIEARAIAVQMIPASAVRRVDMASPGNCLF